MRREVKKREVDEHNGVKGEGHRFCPYMLDENRNYEWLQVKNRHAKRTCGYRCFGQIRIN